VDWRRAGDAQCAECRREKRRNQRRNLSEEAKQQLRTKKTLRQKERFATDEEYRERCRQKRREDWRRDYAKYSPEDRRELRERRLNAWKEGNPEAFRRYKKAKRARHKARRKGAPGRYALENIQAIFEAQKGLCAYFRVCRTKLGDDYHIDHIMPIALGGTSDPGNIQLTCPDCNWAKNAQHPVDFATSIGLLI
jgi:hypothetical protein